METHSLQQISKKNPLPVEAIPLDNQGGTGLKAGPLWGLWRRGDRDCGGLQTGRGKSHISDTPISISGSQYPFLTHFGWARWQDRRDILVCGGHHTTRSFWDKKQRSKIARTWVRPHLPWATRGIALCCFLHCHGLLESWDLLYYPVYRSYYPSLAKGEWRDCLMGAHFLCGIAGRVWEWTAVAVPSIVSVPLVPELQTSSDWSTEFYIYACFTTIRKLLEQSSNYIWKLYSRKFPQLNATWWHHKLLSK